MTFGRHRTDLVAHDDGAVLGAANATLSRREVRKGYGSSDAGGSALVAMSELDDFFDVEHPSPMMSGAHGADRRGNYGRRTASDIIAHDDGSTCAMAAAIADQRDRSRRNHEAYQLQTGTGGGIHVEAVSKDEHKADLARRSAPLKTAGPLWGEQQAYADADADADADAAPRAPRPATYHWDALICSCARILGSTPMRLLMIALLRSPCSHPFFL
jgi:hypothetical protein